MIEIPLSQGQFALIDDEFSELAEFKWHAHRSKGDASFYACRSGGGKTVFLHRAVMELRLGRKLVPGEEVNHVRNADTLDNRIVNLTPRPVSKSENQHWRGKTRANTSGFKGVTWNEERGKWMAKIKTGGISKTIGRFDNVHEAAAAYDVACRQLHGEFAVTNYAHLT